MPSSKEVFLSLVRMGIGHTAETIPIQVNWSEIKALADRQGLSAIVLDGIERLLNVNRPSKDITLPWIGEVVNNYEHRYRRYCEAISSLAGFYSGHGIKMMVLKGYACSLDWPKPNHRPCGDIDIWLFGKQKDADNILVKERGINVDNGHHHHTVFNWRGFSVENHYDFINIHRYTSNRLFEELLKDLGNDDSCIVMLDGETIYLPSANLHALFLLRHSMMDFVASSFTLRQVLDWAFFVSKHTKDIDWTRILDVLKEFHMIDYFNILNAICVDNLGFETKIFPIVQFLPELKERVLEDIIDPTYSREAPKALLPRLYYKYRRWQGNAWKQSLCFNESRCENFLGGISAKLIKPKV